MWSEPELKRQQQHRALTCGLLVASSAFYPAFTQYRFYWHEWLTTSSHKTEIVRNVHPLWGIEPPPTLRSAIQAGWSYIMEQISATDFLAVFGFGWLITTNRCRTSLCWKKPLTQPNPKPKKLKKWFSNLNQIIKIGFR